MGTIIDIIKPALLKDLHIAERSYTLNRQINKSQKEIPTGSKTEIAKMLFDLSYTEMVLSLCRLYDNPSKRYPTRCIKQLYEFIKKNDFQTELKRSPDIALRELKHLHDFPQMFLLLKKLNGAEFNENLILYLEAIELNDPLSASINELKKIRDKFLAHTEDIELNTFIPYKTMEILINHAKEVLSFFSLAYSNVHLTVNGNFYLSHDSLEWAREFRLFIKKTAHNMRLGESLHPIGLAVK